MTIKKLDLWLRGIWSFWDTHGQRLTQVLQTVYSVASAVAVAIYGADGATASILLGIGGAFGLIGRARAQNTADIKSGKIVDPTDQAGA